MSTYTYELFFIHRHISHNEKDASEEASLLQIELLVTSERIAPRNSKLLLDELELIRADAADGADIILGQLGGVDLDLETANDANELVRLVSHDWLLSQAIERRMSIPKFTEHETRQASHARSRISLKRSDMLSEWFPIIKQFL